MPAGPSGAPSTPGPEAAPRPHRRALDLRRQLLSAPRNRRALVPASSWPDPEFVIALVHHSQTAMLVSDGAGVSDFKR
jgi:hypothetical protein